MRFTALLAFAIVAAAEIITFQEFKGHWYYIPSETLIKSFSYAHSWCKYKVCGTLPDLDNEATWLILSEFLRLNNIQETNVYEFSYTLTNRRSGKYKPWAAGQNLSMIGYGHQGYLSAAHNYSMLIEACDSNKHRFICEGTGASGCPPIKSQGDCHFRRRQGRKGFPVGELSTSEASKPEKCSVECCKSAACVSYNIQWNSDGTVTCTYYSGIDYYSKPEIGYSYDFYDETA